MAKYPISKGVTKNVTVGEPKVVEIHRALGGGKAKPGSPAGREAQPRSTREGFKLPPGQGRR